MFPVQDNMLYGEEVCIYNLFIGGTYTGILLIQRGHNIKKECTFSNVESREPFLILMSLPCCAEGFKCLQPDQIQVFKCRQIFFFCQFISCQIFSYISSHFVFPSCNLYIFQLRLYLTEKKKKNTLQHTPASLYFSWI